MQLDLIETFLDLCDSESFTATADRLEVTQSTVSARVSALEKKLGHRLFRRGRAGTALTPEGARFEPHARALRLAWGDAQRALQAPSRAELTLRVGFQPDLIGTQFGAWVGGVRGAAPDAALYLEASFSAHICQELISGALDLGILFTPTPHPDLHYDTLNDIPYELISPVPMAVEDVVPDQYIVPDYSPAFLRQHAEMLPHLSMGLITVGQSNLALPLMQQMGAAAYQPRTTVLALLEQGFHPVAGAPVLSQPVFGAVHIRNRHRKSHRKVLRALSASL